MLEKICCIYDADEKYAIKLMDAMNESMDIPYKVMAYTSEKLLLECSNRYEIEILLVSEDIDCEVISEIKPNHMFTLGEGNTNLENDFICKYQSVEIIIKQLLAGLSDSGIVTNKHHSEIVAAYSPSNTYLKTVLALGYALFQSKGKRILYINLDEFSALNNLFDKSAKDFSDVLFHYISDDDNKMGKIMSCINTKYGIDYFYPVSCPEDIESASVKNILGLVDEIGKSGIYRQIIIDLGSLIKNPWEIMNVSDKIILPEITSEIEEQKYQDFLYYIDRSRYKSLQSKLVKIQVPVKNELMNKCITFAHISDCILERKIQEKENE